MKITKILILFELFFFSILALVGLFVFIAFTYSVNKHGGEMSDGLGFIGMILFGLYCMIFLLWTIKLYQNFIRKKIYKKTYVYHSSLIFIFGIIPSLTIILNPDLIITIVLWIFG